MQFGRGLQLNSTVFLGASKFFTPLAFAGHVDQGVQCEAETAGDELFRQHDWQRQAVAVFGFVAGHGFSETFATYPQPFGPPACLRKLAAGGVLLQPQR